jgi:type II secretory pathway pseudopilin PulG
MLANHFHKKSASATRRRRGGTGLRPASAFTLLEVVLALVIAVAILFVLMFFYHQASNLRTQALNETDRLSAIRLVMDLITSELRTTRFDPAFNQAFVGRSNSIQFIKTDLPSFANWTGGTLGRGAVESDMKLVRYQVEMFDGTNIAGLVRSEEPLVQTYSTPSASPEGDLDQGIIVEELIEEIRFAQFRYWNGVQWLDSWKSPTLPRGIEISLGAEDFPQLDSQSDQDSPVEVFRRVIALPVQNAGDPAASYSESEDDEEDEL